MDKSYTTYQEQVDILKYNLHMPLRFFYDGTLLSSPHPYANDLLPTSVVRFSQQPESFTHFHAFRYLSDYEL